MLAKSILALAASASGVAAVTKGFNYGAKNSDESPVTYDQYKGFFNNAKSLPGTNGFTSGRLYTMIQAGTQGDVTQAIQAAIDTNTRLMLGMWASGGGDVIKAEINALTTAISQYGDKFTSLVDSLSVGSEDLYRNSELGVKANAGIGADPQAVADYIKQVKQALSTTSLSGLPVGHVDTWTAWVNNTNQATIDASDFIGFDAYPYFQSTMDNPIDKAVALFQDAYAQTKAATSGKPIIVTETGWPVSGPDSNQAKATVDNAKTYWQKVGCALLFDQTPTYWFTLQDATPNTPSPSFGIVGSGSTSPLFDLSCNGTNSTSTSSSASATGTGSFATGGACPSCPGGSNGTYTSATPTAPGSGSATGVGAGATGSGSSSGSGASGSSGSSSSGVATGAGAALQPVVGSLLLAAAVGAVALL